MPAIGIALGVEERARRRSVIAQDCGRRAPGGPVGGVDPGEQRRPDREGDALIPGSRWSQSAGWGVACISYQRSNERSWLCGPYPEAAEQGSGVEA
jgi:hypothetical protein